MEETTALLNNLVQTKSVQNALSPIAKQVSQLIVLNEAYDAGSEQQFPDRLLENVSAVQKSIEHLVSVSKRINLDIKDNEFHHASSNANDVLAAAGQNLVTATQRVHLEKFNPSSRRHLIRTAKDVLEGTLKVLTVADQYELSKIQKAIVWVRDRLGRLTVVKSMKTLVPAFKGVTDSVMLLRTLADRREQELTHPQQRERIISSMTSIKKSMPMLGQATQTYVRFPNNAQAQASHEYVVGHMLQCLDDLSDALTNSSIAHDETLDDLHTPGMFSDNVNKLCSLLSCKSGVHIVVLTPDFDSMMEHVIRHSMGVGHLCNEQHHALIAKNCQRVMHQRTEVDDSAQNVTDNPDFTQLALDFEDSCVCLVQELTDLKRHINEAVMWLIADTMKETVEPLDRLVKIAIKSQKQSNDDVDDLDSFVDVFHSHADRVCQVARFATANTEDVRRVRVIRSCLQHLEQLDPEIVPAIFACKGLDNRAAMEHMRLLKTEWQENMQLLVTAIDRIMDQGLFLRVTKQCLTELQRVCQSSMYSEAASIADTVRSVLGHGRRYAFVAAALDVLNGHPKKHKYVNQCVHQINKVLPAIKSSANHVLVNIGDAQSHEVLHKRCDLLVKVVGKIEKTINGGNAMDTMAELFDDDGSDEKDEEEADVGNSINGYTNGPERAKIANNITAKDKHVDDTYLKDLTGDYLVDEVRKLTSAAIGGKLKELDLLCNEVMVTTNHITDVASLIANHVPEQKQVLQRSISELNDITPQVLYKTHCVVECDTYQIESMHQVTETWRKLIHYLEHTVDGLLSRWSLVTQKILDAVKMSNSQLLKLQIQTLDDHKRQIHTLLSAMLQFFDHSDVIMDQCLSELQDHANEFDNLYIMYTTLADLTTNTTENEDSGFQLLQLRRTCRECTCRMYMFEQQVYSLCDTYCKERGVVLASDTQSRVQQVTDQCVRVKSLLTQILQGKCSSSNQTLGYDMMSELTDFCANMSDCNRLLTNPVAAYAETESLYARHKLELSICQILHKVFSIRELIDTLVVQYSGAFTDIHSIVADIKLASPSGKSSSSHLLRLQSSVVELRETERKLSMMSYVNTDDCVNAMQDLSVVCSHVEQNVKIYEDTDNIHVLQSLRHLSQQWAANCQQLMSSLTHLTKSETDELKRLLKIKLGSTGYSRYQEISNTSVLDLTPTKRQHRSEVEHMVKQKALISSTSTEYKRLYNTPRASHYTPQKPTTQSGFKKKSTQPMSTMTHDWDSNENKIIRLATRINEKLKQIISYTQEDNTDTDLDLTHLTQSIAEDCNILVKYAKIFAKYCLDQKCAQDLLFYTDQVPSISTQLTILASVKSASPRDKTAAKMLLQNSSNLLKAVSDVLSAAEATSVKGLKAPSIGMSDDETEALTLASRWKQKLLHHRQREHNTASTDQLGLRKVDQEIVRPALNELINAKRLLKHSTSNVHLI